MSVTLPELRQIAERHSAFTRRIDAPYKGPWKSYWREAARDLQHALDEAIDLLSRAENGQPQP